MCRPLISASRKTSKETANIRDCDGGGSISGESPTTGTVTMPTQIVLRKFSGEEATRPYMKQWLRWGNVKWFGPDDPNGDRNTSEADPRHAETLRQQCGFAGGHLNAAVTPGEKVKVTQTL